MELNSTLIGLFMGVTLTILTEIVKKSSQKKIVASKLFSESIISLREILESDSFVHIQASEKIYSGSDIASSQKKLNIYLEDLKTKMTLDKTKTTNVFNKLKSDKNGIDKYLYLANVHEDKYKNDTLLLSKQEISLLAPYIQSLITEKIENHFNCIVSCRFLFLRINNEEIDMDKFIDDFIEVTRYLIKINKDREVIHEYSKKISNQSLLRSVLLELKFSNF